MQSMGTLVRILSRLEKPVERALTPIFVGAAAVLTRVLKRGKAPGAGAPRSARRPRAGTAARTADACRCRSPATRTRSATGRSTRRWRSSARWVQPRRTVGRPHARGAAGGRGRARRGRRPRRRRQRGQLLLARPGAAAARVRARARGRRARRRRLPFRPGLADPVARLVPSESAPLRREPLVPGRRHAGGGPRQSCATGRGCARASTRGTGILAGVPAERFAAALGHSLAHVHLKEAAPPPAAVRLLGRRNPPARLPAAGADAAGPRVARRRRGPPRPRRRGLRGRGQRRVRGRRRARRGRRPARALAARRHGVSAWGNPWFPHGPPPWPRRSIVRGEPPAGQSPAPATIRSDSLVRKTCHNVTSPRDQEGLARGDEGSSRARRRGWRSARPPRSRRARAR